MTPGIASRVRPLNDRPVQSRGRYVLYWCQMFRRLERNHALDYALARASELGRPLVIYEGLKLNYPWANARFHLFMLQGMQANAKQAKQLGLSYWPFVQTPGCTGRGLVRKLAENASLVVTDDYPAFIVPAHNRALAGTLDVALHAVDSNGVVPLALLGQAVSAAAHLRPRLHKQFAAWWPERAAKSPKVNQVHQAAIEPPFEPWNTEQNVDEFVRSLPVDQSVAPVAQMHGGSLAGRARLNSFVQAGIDRYAEERSQPDSLEHGAASGISPWLHYGHISIEEVVEAALNHSGRWSLDDINHTTRNKNDFFCRDVNVNAFLDEAITWRDVGYHWHYCRVAQNSSSNAASNISWSGSNQPAFNFETMDFSPRRRGTLETVLPAWAWKTLSDHAGDRREHVYTLEEFEAAATHDELWNAAQTELAATGRMHNYLRMLWGKKVLEWSTTPEEAYNVLEHLNNKYALDGRDPNSYTGILWCFGLFDRPWAPRRQVFGTIRYMSSANTARKFKLQRYFDYVEGLRPTAAAAPPGRLF